MSFLKFYPPFLVAAGIFAASDTIPLMSSYEKISLIGLCLVVAIVLWRKLETVEKARLQSHYEQIELLKENSDTLGELMRGSTLAQEKVAESLRGVSKEFHERPCVCSHLLEMLEDSSPSVRKEAIRVLGERGDPRALPALDAIAAGRSDREISKLARQAIAEIRAAR